MRCEPGKKARQKDKNRKEVYAVILVNNREKTAKCQKEKELEAELRR